jgi:hypothetical protein
MRNFDRINRIDRIKKAAVSLPKAILFILFILSIRASANTIYVAQNATGSGSGADSSDCIAASALNGSWTSLGVTTGTTVSFVGQITIPLAVGGSDGSVANNVTMKFPAGAGMLVASSALPSDYAIIRIAANASGLTIDGTGGGYLTLTGNGTGLATQYGTAAVLVESSATALSVKNLQITGLYVHTGFTDASPGADQCQGVYVPNSSGSNFVGGCYFQDVGTCIEANGVSTWVICSNMFQRYNHGIDPTGSSGAYNYISSNYFGSMTNWCTTADTFHNDGIIWGGSGTPAVFAVTNNTFAGPIAGPTDNATAYIFSFANPAAYVPIVNNLFINQPGDPLIGDGDILINGGNLYCINNTFLGNGNTTTALSMSGNGNFAVMNNVFNNFQGNISVQGGLSGTTVFANNLYGNTVGAGGWSLNGTGYNSFSSWAGASGETGGLTATGSDIVNTITGVLPDGSPAIGAGSSTAYSDGVITDIDGNARNSGSMDTGAFVAESTGSATEMIVTLPGQTFTSGSGNSGSVTAQTAGMQFNAAKLSATDSSHNVDATYSGSKTITWSGPANAPGGYTPSYTTTVSFTSGQSTTTLATTLYDAQSTTITATDGSLTGIASSSLTVNSATLNRIRMKTEPGSTVTVNSLFSAEPAINLEDTYGNIVTGNSSSVITAAIDIGSGSLNGTVTATASSGVATFSALKAPTLAQTGLKLLFTDTPDGVSTLDDTTPIAVNAGTAAALAFTTQPGGGSPGAVWSQQPAVTLQDTYGNTKTGTAQNVTLAIENNPVSGSLSGTLTEAVNTSTGIATFSGLSINDAGDGYTLTATGSSVDTSAGAVVSSSFNIFSTTLNYNVKFATP